MLFEIQSKWHDENKNVLIVSHQTDAVTICNSSPTLIGMWKIFGLFLNNTDKWHTHTHTQRMAGTKTGEWGGGGGGGNKRNGAVKVMRRNLFEPPNKNTVRTRFTVRSDKNMSDLNWFHFVYGSGRTHAFVESGRLNGWKYCLFAKLKNQHSQAQHNFVNFAMTICLTIFHFIRWCGRCYFSEKHNINHSQQNNQKCCSFRKWRPLAFSSSIAVLLLALAYANKRIQIKRKPNRAANWTEPNRTEEKKRFHFRSFINDEH